MAKNSMCDCNACHKTFSLSPKMVQQTECKMYDDKIMWVSFLVCPFCKTAYAFLFDDNNTKGQGVNAKRLREVYYKRYLGTVYQPLSPKKKLDIYVPGRNNLEEVTEGKGQE